MKGDFFRFVGGFAVLVGTAIIVLTVSQSLFS